MKSNVTVVEIRFTTSISFWNALKLRLAGGKAVKVFMEDTLKVMKDKVSKECKTN